MTCKVTTCIGLKMQLNAYLIYIMYMYLNNVTNENIYYFDLTLEGIPKEHTVIGKPNSFS